MGPTAPTRHDDRAFINLIEASPFGIYVVDADFRLAHVSAGSRPVFGGIDPLIGRDFAEVLHIIWPEPFASEALAHFRHTLATGEPFHSPDTTEVRANVAATESYDWRLARVVMPDGRFGVVCYFYDVTARVNAEQDARFLAELADECRQATDAVELMRAAIAAIGTYLGVDRCFVNQVFVDEDRWTIDDDYHPSGSSLAGEYRLSDYDPETRALQARGISEVNDDTKTDPRTASRYLTAYEPLGVRADIVVPLLRDGRWIACVAVASGRPRRWQAREVRLLETAADRLWSAVEKLRADAQVREERQESQERLRESEARTELVKDAAQVGFWFCDLPFDTLIWDARVKDHFWLPPDAEVTIDTFYQQIHPDDRERTREAIATSIDNRTHYDTEYRTCGPNGEEKWIRAIGRTFYDAQGHPFRFDGVTLDITDRKRIEQALRENDQRKDEFLAMLAHELRNPLAPIRHAAHILSTGDRTPESNEWAGQIISRQVNQLSRLVDDLLDVSRITRGKIALQLDTVDLSVVVDRARETHQPLAEQRRQRLIVQAPDTPVFVRGDMTRLVQVVSNLVHNAVKFTPEQGDISIAIAQGDGHAVLRVRDTGEGIPAPLLASIFDLFHQGNQSLDRSQGGLGIGLTLVQRLVEMHGGTVRASSAGAHKGSEFVVTLPLAPSPAPAARADGPVSPVMERRPLKVLVIEDNKDGADVIEMLLRLNGDEVQVALDGQEGLDAARRWLPDVVLCDLGLPRVDGFAVARQLRADPACSRMRLMALSGYSHQESRDRASDAGFDDYLVKPVEPVVLTARLDALRANR